LSYQWKSNGISIAGATTATLIVPLASVGQTITVSVTGTKTGYDPLMKVSVPTTAVTNVITGPTPTITGTAKVGSTLTANARAWAPTPVTLAYSWKTGTTVLGSRSTLVVPASAYGKTITVTVTGSKNGSTAEAQAPAGTRAGDAR